MSIKARSACWSGYGGLLLFAALLLGSCAGGPSPVPGGVQQAAIIQRVRTNARNKELLYVGNYEPAQSVTFYNTGKDKLLGTISGSLSAPSPFVSPTGELYVTNYLGKSVAVYSAGSHKLVRTLTREIRFPSQVIFDSTGDAYVRTRDSVLFFPNGRERGLHSIKIRSYAIALDGDNNLYVASYDAREIEIFKPGAKTPFKIISDGIGSAFDIALDGAGNLYVANWDLASGCGDVTEYDAQNQTLALTITQGVCNPTKLAIGTDGNLYVLNLGSTNDVTEYPLGENKLLRTVGGLDEPATIITDENANLYVANRSNVTVYASGSNAVLRTITDGIDEPIGLAIGK
jgi:hypothetical protein